MKDQPAPPALTGPPGGLAELARLVRDAAATGAMREALCVRLSRLPPALRKATHRRLIAASLAPTRECGRVRAFDLPNRDQVLIAAPPARDLAMAREALAALLGEAVDSVCATLRLPGESAALLAAMEDGLGLPPARAKGASEVPLDAAGLAALERALAQADLEPYQREQMVARITPEASAPRPAWQDRRIEITELRDRLLPGADWESDPALARRLRRSVDRRVLADLARTGIAARLPALGVPLALASVTGPEFLRLDAALPARGRAALLIGLDAADLLADPGAFAFAAAFAAARGYRFALEAAEPATALLLPPRPAGIGVLRLAWSAALAREAAAVRALAAAGHEIVLAGADRPAAIAWGWEAGVRLFQGRVVDRALRG
jgi:hypothetical protein